jgi:CheY-like chemotaxis protein
MTPILNHIVLLFSWNDLWPWLSLLLITSAALFFLYRSWASKLKHHEAESSSRTLELQALLHHSRENEKKIAEEMKAKEDAFRKTIVELNHEIRTPLNAITGMSGLLEGTSLNLEQQEYLKSIQNCSDDLTDALDRVVNSTDIAAGEEIVEEAQNEQADLETKEIIMNFSSEFAARYPLKVLVAEDDLMNQQLAAMLLKKLGYTPDLAADGQTVLEMVSEKAYDIILMDVQMPVMDGLQATRMIRLCLTVQPVIVAMTANSLNGDRELCLEAGMNDYISKPVHKDLLMEKLGQWSLRTSK